MNNWINISKRKPEDNQRVLICDENGWVDIDDTQSIEHWNHTGHEEGTTWFSSWECGNGTKIVAWMPLPDFPEKLCNPDANGEMP